jgi:hypothetical protein
MKVPGKVGDLQCAADAVVVGDGHMGHAPPSGDVVELQGFGKAFGAVDFLQDPLGGPLGVLGVHVQIDPHRFSFL